MCGGGGGYWSVLVSGFALEICISFHWSYKEHNFNDYSAGFRRQMFLSELIIKFGFSCILASF